jgi:hypothetical protein
MELENILYAGVQIAHNFGAAAVAGLPIAALWFAPAQPAARKVAWLTLLAWLTQCASGAGFGIVSFTMEGELPQLHSLAMVALGVKILCAVLAIFLLAMNLVMRVKTPLGNRTWISLTFFGFTALTCAAILRWFS